MSKFHLATPVDCRLCVSTTGARKTGRAIPTVVPNGAGTPVQVNVMRCTVCDVTPCHACGQVTLKVNQRYCECGALLLPKGKR